ncbi:MAG TPA: circularly permuted type 2 ATP-grasp protein, partial [Rhizomicrobium sp.]|nr:circularly permuted type 2 ATP-grasp protein [Rhizomicrobium sp.]
MSEISFAQPSHQGARFDELRDSDGTIRPHWRSFAKTLTGLSAEEFAKRRASAGAMVRDNGVTYNVYDETAGQTRPWQLDIVPFILSAADWRTIEAAVVQRARLADALLADIYGERRLICEGHLPPHLVYGHPQFLRPLVGA